MRYFIIGFFLLLYTCNGFAQSLYRAETIKFNQGLPSDFVYSTIKKEGYLYIATQRGLCQYDGYQFIKNSEINSEINPNCISKSFLMTKFLEAEEFLMSVCPKSGVRFWKLIFR